MGGSQKVVEALRGGILLNERVSVLIDKVHRMDEDMRKMNERIIRLETLVEVAKMGAGRK
jgi:hypothetical protein